MQKLPPAITICRECSKEISLTGDRLYKFRERGYAYCTVECSKIFKYRLSSIRMSAQNPMANLESKEKMRTSLKRIGHKPIVRGGNGTGLTVPQNILANALNWETELIIRTGLPRNLGYPTCYKLDVANRNLKIAIEIDGRSHGLLIRKEQDIKKTSFLRWLGWTVFRFSNKQIINNLDFCLKTIGAYAP